MKLWNIFLVSFYSVMNADNSILNGCVFLNLFHLGIHCHSMMGTFAEIRRAWLVVDSDLFLWDFEYGSVFLHFFEMLKLFTK